jgi:hypothetical protein
VVDWRSKTYNNRVRERETTLKLHGWVSSLLQARPSLVLAIGSTAESGFIGIGKHDKNMYLPCVGWIALDSAVIAGVVIYG